MVLPDLFSDFNSYLAVTSSATAGDDLKELFKSRLTISSGGDTAIDRDVTLEPENITLSLSAIA
jgi:hypothetical protein